MTAPSDLLTPELERDFEAEADEHLLGIRRNLLALEPQAGNSSMPPSILEELFRHFHSLKGLSAMVELHPAEQLAHQMESYLRLLRQKQAVLSAEGMDSLAAGTRVLEDVITARRKSAPLPPIADVMAQLEQLVSPAISQAPPQTASTTPQGPAVQIPGLDDESSALLAGALERGAHAWRFEFKPVPELIERGISVNVIRERLRGIGDVIRAAPRVTSDGGIVFEFLVTSSEPETRFADWAADGLTYTPLEVTLPLPAALPLQSPAPPLNPPATPALAEQAKSSGAGITLSNIVRVELSRLDDLIQMVAGLVITRGRLEENINRLAPTLPLGEWRALQEINFALERELRGLRQGVMRVRLVPVGEVFERMHFVLRDLAREAHKKVQLDIQGRDTEVDKLVVDRMLDPLLHLVRNAVSHGIETPEERRAAGKPEKGTITLRASTAGDLVVIEVQDDGRGIDPEAVLARARELNLVDPGATPQTLSLLDVLSLSGFTTRVQADRASGRGVGMTVVKHAVQELGGVLTLETERGHWTRFTLELPITLAIVDALIVAVGDQVFAVPLPLVREVIEIAPGSINVMENNEIIPFRGGALALARLSRRFRLEEKPGRALYALLTSSGSGARGIVVDRILNQREIVVHPLLDPLVHMTGFSGATDLGNGRPVLIVDAAALARLSTGNGARHARE